MKILPRPSVIESDLDAPLDFDEGFKMFLEEEDKAELEEMNQKKRKKVEKIKNVMTDYLMVQIKQSVAVNPEVAESIGIDSNSYDSGENDSDEAEKQKFFGKAEVSKMQSLRSSVKKSKKDHPEIDEQAIMDFIEKEAQDQLQRKVTAEIEKRLSDDTELGKHVEEEIKASFLKLSQV